MGYMALYYRKLELEEIQKIAKSMQNKMIFKLGN